MDLGGEMDLKNTQRCLIGYAVVAYMRPFKRSSAHDRATRSISLYEIGVELSEKHRKIHEQIEFMRDKLIAHSDFEEKELAPANPHAARAISKPTYMHLDSIDYIGFHELLREVVKSMDAYKQRLESQFGDRLMA